MAKGDGKSKGHGKACHGCHGKIMKCCFGDTENI
jgi:hypothetical protein